MFASTVYADQTRRAPVFWTKLTDGRNGSWHACCESGRSGQGRTGLQDGRLKQWQCLPTEVLGEGQVQGGAAVWQPRLFVATNPSLGFHRW